MIIKGTDGRWVEIGPLQHLVELKILNFKFVADSFILLFEDEVLKPRLLLNSLNGEVELLLQSQFFFFKESEVLELDLVLVLKVSELDFKFFYFLLERFLLGFNLLLLLHFLDEELDLFLHGLERFIVFATFLLYLLQNLAVRFLFFGVEIDLILEGLNHLEVGGGDV